MGKWCLHASSFIFVRIIIKVAGNQDRHKSMVEFEFGTNQTTHFGVTCPWVTKISHFWTWISLKRGGQSWSNFMCSIIGVGERLHKVLGLIDLGKLDSGERSLPFGLLVYLNRLARQLSAHAQYCTFRTYIKKYNFFPDFSLSLLFSALPLFSLQVCICTGPCFLKMPAFFRIPIHIAKNGAYMSGGRKCKK